MNLLLITIDSLRWDYVGRNNPQIQTPVFDNLTKHFRFTDRFFAVSSATRPVHSSLFTGLYPFEHEVLGMQYPAMRAGVPHLFSACERAGYQVNGFSQALNIFTGLEFSRWLVPYQAKQIQQVVNSNNPSKCLFLHYWSTHTPYGAADGKALGETLDLLRGGQTQRVQKRYIQTIEKLFEHELVPLLQSLDMANWCIVILSDHGESWTIEEPYHGQTLNNSVLRIPLYFHIPHSGNPPFARSINSQIDIIPTLIKLLNLPLSYRGFGEDLYKKKSACLAPYYLAQIDPLATHDDDANTLIHTLPTIKSHKKWVLFDEEIKFSLNEEDQSSKFEDLFSENPLTSHPPKQHFFKAFEKLVQNSKYNTSSIKTVDLNTNPLLEQRLKELGYLE